MRIEKLRDLLARLHALPRKRLTLLVAVDGPAGSGKTTFTRALTGLDPGLDVIEIADFAAPRSEPPEQSGEPSTGRVGAAVDWRRLRSTVLLPLSRDQPARYQRYDPATAAMAEWRLVSVGGIVIVEGLYSCIKALTTFYDFRVWIDCPLDVRRRRLESGDDTELLLERAWLPAEKAYVTDQNPAASAHLRVDGSGTVAHDPTGEYVRLR